MLNAVLSKSTNHSSPNQSPSVLKSMGITVCESIVTKTFSFFTILLLTRFLGPEEYGKYSFIFVMIALLSAIFDFGMENTAVRFASKSKDSALSIFGLYLVLKIVILSGLIIMLVVLGPECLRLMHKQEMSPFIPLLIIGLIGESLFFVNDTYLQACQNFIVRARFNIVRYFSVFVYILLLVYFKQIFLKNVLFGYFIPIAFATFFIKQYLIFLKTLVRRPLTKSFLNEMFHYEKWMFTYSVTYNLLGRIDFLMLGFWVGYQQLGIYNAAFQLCSIVSFLPMAIGKVLLPTLSELSVQEIHIQVRKMMRCTVWICVGSLCLIPILAYVVPMLFGKTYISAIPIIQVLLLAFLLSLLAMPYEQAIYSFGNPKVLSLGRYLQLMLIVGINIILLNVFHGQYGAWIVAISTLLGRLLYFYFARFFYSSIHSKMIMAAASLVSLEACV